jgi:hypothetical protein
MFKVQIKFDNADLIRLFSASLHKWSGGAKFDSITIKCDGAGRAWGYAFQCDRGRTRVDFSHDVIVAGIALASAAEGNPVADGSLLFSHQEGLGYAGGSTVSATASPAENNAANSDPASAAPSVGGTAKFPGTVTISFSVKELRELLIAAAKRAGEEATAAIFFYSETDGTAARITVKTAGGASGSASLTPAELNTALRDELAARGCSVAENGFKFNYSEGGYGGGSGTSLTVTLSSLTTAG